MNVKDNNELETKKKSNSKKKTTNRINSSKTKAKE